MIRYRYSFAALAPDYARAAAGTLLTGAPVLFADLASVMLWLLGGLAVLFLTFGVRTAIRQATSVEISAKRVRVDGPFGATINWEELQGLDVRYFSTKRDRTGGWMQLTLRGKGRSIRIDSTIDGFADLARRADMAAQARGVHMTASSRANLDALGYGLDASGGRRAGGHAG
ncbi:MAG TPA: hypothetical protein VEU47_09700 [Candidatus Cybelea sp.]|nr:hypothetical protein [Candidatus Cybelea sp.]